MKNMIKVFGIIALVAVIGFGMTACGGDGGGGGGGNLTINVKNEYTNPITNIKVYQTDGSWNIQGAAKYDSGTINITTNNTHGPFQVTGLQTGAIGHTTIRIDVTATGASSTWTTDNPTSGSTVTYTLKSSGSLGK